MYLKLFVFAVNPDNVWGARLHRSKGLSLAEMGTFGKSARPCTILYMVSCRDGNIWEVSKTMYKFVHYTEFHLLSPGSKSREI